MIGFDCDGVVYDIAVPIAEIASEMLGRPVVREDITKYGLTECLDTDEDTVKELIRRCQEDHWLRPELIIPGAREFLNKQWNEMGYPVVVITARPNAQVTREYLCQELAVDPRRVKVVTAHSYDKGQIAYQMGLTHFVDDYFKSLNAVMDEGIHPILFDQPWNQVWPDINARTWQLVDRVKNWEELWKYVE